MASTSSKDSMIAAGSQSSPSTSSSQGGGAPVDGMENLTLTGTAARGRYEPPHVRADSTKSERFLVGAVDDEDVFGAQMAPRYSHEESINFPASDSIGAYNHGQTTTMASLMAAQVAPSFLRRVPTPVRSTRANRSENRHEVEGVDAQIYYSPEACVFVANLPEAKSDSVLEAAITKAFLTFGSVFVKIRRDPKNMPFAFCQFTRKEHADVAEKQGKGMLIEGRACRTEKVKANRAFVVFSVAGLDVDVEQAQYELVQFGAIAKCQRLEEEYAVAMNLHGAVMVEFEKFDPGRDIVAHYRNNPYWRVIAYDIKKVNKPPVDAAEQYLKRYEVDRRSIYIGGLPSDVTNLDEIIEAAAGQYGEVKSLQVIRKPLPDGSRTVVFAFVEFSRPDVAELACQNMRDTIIADARVKVQRKNSKDPNGTIRHPRVTHVQLPPIQRQQASPDVSTIKKEEPSTPLRVGAVNTGNSGTRSGGYAGYGTPSAHSYGAYTYGGGFGGGQGQYGGVNYGASPYYPATPGYYSQQQQQQPYWPTPFVQEGNFGPMAYYSNTQGFGASPMPAGPAFRAEEEGISGTPTKAKSEYSDKNTEF
ncbi:Uu.00g113120.m01.CDS01 [Anthostomella pinea]|uniref:Uu.00g113120.m01.CDS01 n=1 Tax=Anthostomella pinea TaxID=933095 RepID=A0AAI8VFF7_9PEZI|nr:Uu.00g113120.m01.CDS01 [Anthostomella pinea]